MMNDITKFGIENFKVFNTLQDFKIKPITILTGKNNSGKSSFIQALKFLSKTFQKSIFSEVELTDPEHNLGDFNNVKNFNNSKNNISFYINDSKLVYCPNNLLTNVAFLDEIIINDQDNKTLAKIQPVLGTIDTSDFFMISAEYKNLIQRYLLDNNSNKELTIKKIRLLTTFITDLYKNKQNILDISFGGSMPVRDYQSDFIHGLDSFIEIEFQNKKLHYKIKKEKKDELKKKLKQKLKQLKAKDTKFENLSNEDEEFLIHYTLEIFVYLLSKIKNYFEGILIGKVKDITFIGAFRGFPERLYKSKNTSGFIGEVIYNHIRIKSAQKAGTSVLNSDAESFVKKWLNIFEIGSNYELLSHPNLGNELLIQMTNSNKISLCDLGFGSMQLLSIILLISNMEYKRYHDNNLSDIICIEEPESHLHPKLQSLLADLFIDALTEYKGRGSIGSFILETHSEYMIRRFQYLVANGKINADDIVIYYFNNPNEVAEGAEPIKELHIREDGMMDGDFGPGFFDESTRLTIDLLKLQNKN